MKKSRFLLYVIYSRKRPEGVSAPRWRGMLRWLAVHCGM